MKAEKITAKKVRSIFLYDAVTGIFRYRYTRGPRAPAGAIAGSLHHKGYRVLTINKRSYQAHRIAWLFYYGKFPKKQIDHINGVKDDNRIANLREASNSQNKKNTKVRSDNAIGVKGVSLRFRAGRPFYVVRIQVEGKRLHLGEFVDIGHAASVYWGAAQKYYGEFARAA